MMQNLGTFTWQNRYASQERTRNLVCIQTGVFVEFRPLLSPSSPLWDVLESFLGIEFLKFLPDLHNEPVSPVEQGWPQGEGLEPAIPSYWIVAGPLICNIDLLPHFLLHSNTHPFSKVIQQQQYFRYVMLLWSQGSAHFCISHLLIKNCHVWAFVYT